MKASDLLKARTTEEGRIVFSKRDAGIRPRRYLSPRDVTLKLWMEVFGDLADDEGDVDLQEERTAEEAERLARAIDRFIDAVEKTADRITESQWVREFNHPQSQ